MQQNYRADIDGLRFLAVSSVFLYHLQPQLLPGGFLGVDIFFIISGYLITRILLRETSNGTFSLTNFYARRIKRIFPALFTVIILFTPLAIISFAPETYNNYMRSAKYAAVQLSNFLFARKTGYFDEGFQTQPLLHTWSLGVEEQFYLFWPLLIYLCSLFIQKKQKKSAATMAIILLAIAITSYTACSIFLKNSYSLAFYMFFSRAWEFCIGGILCLDILPKTENKRLNHLLGIAGISLLLLSFFLVSDEFLGLPFLQFGIFLPSLGCALLIYLRPKNSIANRFLAQKFPVFIGKISYSLYLYHWPIIIFWQILFNRHQHNLASTMAIIALSLFLATISYYYIEQPARKIKIDNRKVLLSGLFAVLTCAIFFKFSERYDSALWRIERYNPKSGTLLDPHIYSIRKKNGIVHNEYNIKDKTTPIIALAGDSHTTHFLAPTINWAKKNGYGVRSLKVAGCPMLAGNIQIKSRIAPQQEEKCNAALPFFAKEIIADPQVKIVIIAQRFDLFYDGRGYLQNKQNITFLNAKKDDIADHKTYYSQQLTNTVQTIRKQGKKVILAQQIPLLNRGRDYQWKPLVKKWLSLERPSSYDSAFLQKWQQPSRNFIADLAKKEDIAVLDIFPYFVSPIIDDASIYADSDHLNGWGCMIVPPFFEKEMDKIMQAR